jgi:enoyl-CoA hydratase/carnithine racemase
VAIELKRIDEFELITLNRPQALNALSVGMAAFIGKRKPKFNDE